MLYNKTTLGLSREKPLEKFFDITRVKGLPFLHLVDINYIYIYSLVVVLDSFS